MHNPRCFVYIHIHNHCLVYTHTNTHTSKHTITNTQELQRKLGKPAAADSNGNTSLDVDGTTTLSDALTGSSYSDIPFELRAVEVVLDTVRVCI